MNDNDFNQLEESHQTKLHQFEYHISPSIQTEISIELITIITHTNSDFHQSKLNFKSLKFEKDSERVSDIHPTKLLSTIVISLNSQERIYVKKSLFKIKDFISSFGGLMKGATVFFFFIYWPIREIMYYRKLVNETFLLCNDQETFKKLVKNSIEKADRNMTRRSTRRKINRGRRGTGPSMKMFADSRDVKKQLKNNEDNYEIKDLVDKVKKIKNQFGNKGLFHNIVQNDQTSSKKLGL